MTDGTRWYHGGFPGLKRGQQILPPSVTGAISIADKVIDAPDSMREQVAKVHDPDLVYLSQDIADARLWAALAPAHGGKNRGGDLYEVTPPCDHRDRPSCPKCSARRTALANARLVREAGGNGCDD